MRELATAAAVGAGVGMAGVIGVGFILLHLEKKRTAAMLEYRRRANLRALREQGRAGWPWSDDVPHEPRGGGSQG